MVIWITGLSGAGKSTLGHAVWEQWRRLAPNTVLVDGDGVRALLGSEENRDYTLEGRRRVAERICDICRWLDGQGINLVCCTISSFEEIREENRKTLSQYFEVYLSVPLDVAARRDRKDLYEPAFRGEKQNVVGIDIPFVPPARPDLVIDNSKDGADMAVLARTVLDAALEGRGCGSSTRES